MDFNIISWNINGLIDKWKRNKIERILKKNSWNIIGLQETHISQKHEKILSNKRLWMEFISSNKKKKGGVVIYVKSSIKSEKLFQDDEGRMVGVRLYLPEGNVVVINIYAPNGCKREFLKKLGGKMGEHITDEEIILFGDFNGVMQPELDRSKNGKKGRGRLPEIFLNLSRNYELVDIW